ncbi:MAG: Undecaprenyl-diphosphatase [Chloroflexi bacterium ADurb.Bin325]|nr:MAG: Undecaprenyl-diphosphatase [Chloroflexi bacterium ADurb.Bin325]
MNLIQGIILGIVQGLTEFIPVSSSGHLVLIPWALDWPAPGLLFDTMVHWGTLLAVVAYFWRDWLGVIRGFLASLTLRGPWSTAAGGRLAAPESRLAWGLILGTLPAVIIGVLFNEFFESLFGTPVAVAAFLFVTALILIVSERLGQRVRGLDTLKIPDALAIGIGQALAIAPGVSRSGATIAVGLARGLTREAAARFSFMLSTPIIAGAGAQQLLKVILNHETAPDLAVVVGGFLAAALSGYLCIRYLLAYLRRGKLYVFAAYCIVVGVAALALALAR